MHEEKPIKNLSSMINEKKCSQLLEAIKNEKNVELVIVYPTTDNTLKWNDVPILMFTGGVGIDGKKNNAIVTLREMMKREYPNDVWTNKIVGSRIVFSCEDCPSVEKIDQYEEINNNS